MSVPPWIWPPVTGGGPSGPVTTDDVTNESSVPGATATDALNSLLADVQPLLTTNRTVYVNAATGSDSAAGTALDPWQTLARAWADRQLYGELRAVYTIQCQGVGPFTLPEMVGSVAGENGFFCILGDPAVEIVLAAGTFDGNITGYVVPTLPGLGEGDPWGGEAIKILTGALAGARVMLAQNTDTSITVMMHQAWDFLGATAPGDTFEVRQPGTEIAVSGVTPIQAFSGVFEAGAPRHIISNVLLTGFGLTVQNAQLAMVGCRCTTGILTQSAQVSAGLPSDATIAAVVNATNAYAWGVQSTNFWQSAASQLTWYAITNAGSGFFGGSAGLGDEVLIAGARINAIVEMLGNGKIEAYGSGYIEARAKFLVDTGSVFSYFTVDQIANFEVTSGDCLRASSGAVILIDTVTVPFGGAIMGGTSDEGGGFGCNARGGGRINWVSQTPTLLGGVLNQDIAAGPVPVANATLAADGDGEADAATLSVVARITGAV